ncbi:uncharacterized protein TA04640 [Theileria annulata]|uniref:Integral membrane protein n=1 Tax=Theileria annulata TaxID=5874 RepID=Q4UCW4_THEAN|nr:uncharacterized protein TA04640 [Theileria annulata]CAI75337.1 hypothetical protein, conserved [Theileria annulata]|eukprot:XP_954813.1 hypothetical protein, conserved [Theileria annulata]
MEECIYSCDDESQLTSSTYTPRSGFELNENYIILEPEDKTLKSTYEISSTFFCRILTLIYFFSFLSNFNQILPLFGTNGLFSTTNTGLMGTTTGLTGGSTGLTGGSTVFTGYDNIKLENKTFYESISEFPSIFLIIPITDFTLRLIPLIGLFISFLMFLTGFHCMYSFLILWILKLSLVALFKFIPKLLSDLLLLEIGFLTIFIFSPFKFFDKYLNLEVSSIIIWSFRFLSYRIIFLSGIYRIFLKCSVKYILTSIPLPTFFTHLLLRLITKYNFLNHLLTAVLLFFEVILSIFLITPFRNCNIFAGIGLLVYSCIFMILGNFGPFYILLGLCSLFCLDDQFLAFTKSKFNPFIKSDHLMKSISIDIIESIIDQYDGDVDGVVDGVGVGSVDGVGVDIENFTNIPENTLNSRNTLNNSRITRSNNLDGGLDSTVDGSLDGTLDGTDGTVDVGLDSTVEEHIFEMNIENITKIFTREFYKKIFNDILIIFFIIIIIISSILLFLFPKYKNFKAFLLFLFCIFLKSYCENKFTTPHHTIEGNNPIHSNNTIENSNRVQNTKYIVKGNNIVENTIVQGNIVENTIVYGNKYKLCVLYILYILQCILIFEIIKNGPNIWSFLLWIGIIELQINLSKKINNFHYLIKMIIKSFLFIHFLFYNFKIFYSSVTVLGPTPTVVPNTTTTNTNTIHTFNTNTGLINTPYNLNNLNTTYNTVNSTLNTVNTTTGTTGTGGGIGIGMNNFYSINNYRNIYNINKERYEIVIEGTNENFVTTNTHWIEYYFKRKPSKLDQFPHFIPFYQYYFDNLLINFVNSVTVLGQANNIPPNNTKDINSTTGTFSTLGKGAVDTVGASTVTEEKNPNESAAVTKSRESGTNSEGDGVNTKGLGTVTKETPLGAVGTTVGREPDTVTYKMDKYIFNIIRMLLMGSEEIKKLMNDPFEGTKPKYVRILIYKYYFTSTFQNKTHNWYYRNFITQFIPPLCYSPVTVLGPTASNGTDSTVVPGTKETKDPTGASTVMEEKNLNKIAVVTNFGESDTNSNTKVKGANLDTTTGDTTVGASTVTENNIINKSVTLNNTNVSLNNKSVSLNNKSVPLNMAESFNHKLPNVDGIIITSK